MNRSPDYVITFVRSGNKIRSLVLTLLTLTSCVLTAQNNTYQVDFGIGISNFHVSDNLTSPLIFCGTGFSPSAKIFISGSRIAHSVELSYAHAFLNASSDNYKTENWRGSGRYSLHYSVLDPANNKRTRIEIGGSLSSFFCKSDYYFYLQSFWAVATSSWYWRHSFDLSARAWQNLSEKDIVSFRMLVPLVCNISRPTFSTSGDYNYQTNKREVKPFGTTMLFPENFSIETSLSYYRVISARWLLFGEYDFGFTSYNDPDKIQLFMNNFRIGISIKMKKQDK
jgi:hypothetical protein